VERRGKRIRQHGAPRGSPSFFGLSFEVVVSFDVVCVG
jgi:hypothetical protein